MSSNRSHTYHRLPEKALLFDLTVAVRRVLEKLSLLGVVIGVASICESHLASDSSNSDSLAIIKAALVYGAVPTSPGNSWFLIFMDRLSGSRSLEFSDSEVGEL